MISTLLSFIVIAIIICTVGLTGVIDAFTTVSAILVSALTFIIVSIKKK